MVHLKMYILFEMVISNAMFNKEYMVLASGSLAVPVVPVYDVEMKSK